MNHNQLHITNGNALTDYLRELDFKDDILTWQEMLCEGHTPFHINSDAFFKQRATFLKEEYGFDVNFEELNTELAKLENTENYTEINLWFEYDLFCHINLLGVINLLHQKEIDKPLYLICSGRIEGEKNLKGLGELKPNQLREHYNNKVLLSKDDITLAIKLWEIYCSKSHNDFKPYITQSSSFKYMGSCLKAHLRRFPHQHNGLSMLEEHILKLIKDNTIKSKHHLLGYTLNYQGYYGFGDTQLNRIIDKLAMFYDKTEDSITLNRQGHRALLGNKNFSKDLDTNFIVGNVNTKDFIFNVQENRLVKTV